MTTGTGLDTQLGLKLESTYGTAVTVDKFLEFDSEGLKFVPTWVEPKSLRVGIKHKRDSRVVQSRKTVSGPIKLPHATRLMGALWKLMLGSTVTSPTLITGTAYKQVHQPGDFLGKSATFQVGRPEPGGTVRPHTFAGCKVKGWEFSVSDNDFASLSLDIDGRDESTATALATASYVAAEVFGFNQATVFKLGGTPSTASGEVSIAGGVTVPAVVKSFSLKGNTPMADDRYGLGNAGLKSEPLENDIPTLTGSLEAEYDRTTFYDPFKANTSTALQLSLIGSQIAATGQFNTLDLVIARLKFKDVSPVVAGPDIVRASVDFEVYSNEVDAVFQAKLISADSAAL